MMKAILMLAFALSLAAQTFVYAPGAPHDCTVPSVPGFNVAPSVCLTRDVYKAFSVPALAGEYADPNFGAQVRIVSGRGFVQTYSTPTPLSATGKYVATGDAGATRVWRTADGADLGKHGPSQDWGFWWHGTDDERYYALENDKFYSCGLDGACVLALDAPARGLTSLRTGGTGDLSRDGWVAFMTTKPKLADGNQPPDKYCLAPLDGSQRVWCIAAAQVPNVDLMQTTDFLLLSRGVDVRTGKRYINVQTGATMLSFDGAALKVEFASPEHPDARLWGRGDGDGVCETGEWCKGARLNHADAVEIEGKQYLWSDYEREGPAPEVSLALYDMTDATITPQLVLATAVRGSGIKGSSSHYSCARNAPVCAVGMQYDKVALDGSDVARLSAPYAWAGQVMTFDFAKTPVEVRPLAMHRSLQWTDYHESYADMPKCAIAPDAGSVACGSNFGYPSNPYPGDASDTRRTMMVRTSAPVASVFACVVTAGALPFGLTIRSVETGCEVTGVPERAGTFTFTVEVRAEGAVAAKHEYTIVVDAPQPQVRIETPALPSGTVGVAYAARVEARMVR